MLQIYGLLEKKSNGTISYLFDADAFITKGTTKLVVDLLNNQLISDIADLKKMISSPWYNGAFNGSKTKWTWKFN